MTAKERPIDYGGILDLLFGGLPEGCGTEVLLQHLRQLELLGARLALLYPEAAGHRFWEESVDVLSKPERLAKALERGLAEWRERPPVIPKVEWSLASEIWNEYTDFLHDLEHNLGISQADIRADEIHCLVPLLLPNDANWESSSLESLVHCPRDMLQFWGAQDLVDPPAADELCSLDGLHLMMGLHEVLRSPWRVQGTLYSGRLADPELLDALRGVNRHYLFALFVTGWLWSKVPLLEDLEERHRTLVSLTIPGDLPDTLDEALTEICEAYLEGRAGTVITLSRVVLEEAIRRVPEIDVDEAPFGLFKRVNYLQQKGVLPEAVARRAHMIRLRGNKALHEEFPRRDHAGALDTISGLMEVLSVLQERIQSPN